MKPSDYLNRNCFFAASTPGEDDIDRRHLIGIGNLMWGNDLPHPEGTFPYTRYWIHERFHDVPEAETRRILGLTAADVYGVDLERAAAAGRTDRPDTRRSPRRRALAARSGRRLNQGVSMSITDHHGFETFNGFPMPRDPAGAGRSRPPPDRAEHERASRASRSRSRTAGSSSPKRRDLTPGEVRTFNVFGTGRRAVPRRGRRAAHGRRVLRAPRRAPRRRRPGRGRLHPVPVPRLALRRRQRAVQRDPVRRHGPHPEPGAASARIPCIERNQMIWAWHHGEQGDPFYEVPEVPELFDAGVVALRARRVRRRDVLPGDGGEQRRLRPLHVRARHRRDPRRRVLRRRHVQANGRGRRQLRARGLRARARRAARQGLHDVHLVDDADRRGEREGPLDLHGARRERCRRRRSRRR